MSSKIVSPFTSPLTANGLKVWLGSCEDGFDNYEDTHDKKLVPKTHIRLTGGVFGIGYMRVVVKKLKDHFMPVNWKMDTLKQFYGCSQGKHEFYTFAADLMQCLRTLPSATISTTVYKHHILFYTHPLLYLHMCALQGFNINSSSQTPDELIALMGSHKPTDPGWIPHQHYTCAGNPAIGACPGKDYKPSTASPVTAANTIATAVFEEESLSGDNPKNPFLQLSRLHFYTHQQTFGVQEPLTQAPELHFSTGQQDPGVRDPYSHMSDTYFPSYRNRDTGGPRVMTHRALVMAEEWEVMMDAVAEFRVRIQGCSSGVTSIRVRGLPLQSPYDPYEYPLFSGTLTAAGVMHHTSIAIDDNTDEDI
ncbi:hypothetical protein M422DRAFT_242110 [Sphaerobolus stellatus SS14]|nr:hypothetical protein M422DRAFT_242110 [Sphaerobolus stellatus SS14]